MGYLRVWIDDDEALEDISTETLEAELRARNAEKLPDAPGKREVAQSLDDAAFALRKAGKTALAWRLDEIRHDYFQEKP